MITGENIKLRLVLEKDLTELYEQLCDLKKRGKYFPLILIPEPEFKAQHAQTGFWKEDFGRLIIADKKEKIIGCLWYFKIYPYADSLEIAYIIFDEKNRNKGYATEAMNLLADYLFKTRRLNRLQLCTIINNVTSEHVAKKCGFSHEGVSREAAYHHGRDVDLNVFSLLRKEWEEMRNK